jgi:hypothetical protein
LMVTALAMFSNLKYKGNREPAHQARICRAT